MTHTNLSPRVHRALFAIVVMVCLVLGVSCVTRRPMQAEAHRWWSGLGPVLPHDSFPADCSLCHVGTKWNKLRDDFEFDHKARTGVALEGAHKTAQCLRCHNDRGSVAVFARKGCVGCQLPVDGRPRQHDLLALSSRGSRREVRSDRHRVRHLPQGGARTDRQPAAHSAGMGGSLQPVSHFDALGARNASELRRNAQRGSSAPASGRKQEHG